MCTCGLNCLWLGRYQTPWSKPNQSPKPRPKPRPRKPKSTTKSVSRSLRASPSQIPSSHSLPPQLQPQPQLTPTPAPLPYYPRPLLGHQHHDSSVFAAARVDTLTQRIQHPVNSDDEDASRSNTANIIADGNGFHPGLLGGGPADFFRASSFGARLDGPPDLDGGGGGGGMLGFVDQQSQTKKQGQGQLALQRRLPDPSSHLGLFHSGSSALALGAGAGSGIGAGAGAGIEHTQQHSRGLDVARGRAQLPPPHTLLLQDTDGPSQSLFGRPSAYHSHQLGLPLTIPFEQLPDSGSGSGHGQGRLKQAQLGRSLEIEEVGDEEEREVEGDGRLGRGRGGGGLRGVEGTMMRLRGDSTERNGKKGRGLGFRDGL